MLRFPYQPENLSSAAPPTLAAGATVRWRPLIPITVVGPTGLVRRYSRAVVDPAADDTIFPIDMAARIGVRLRPPTGHGVRWRGQLHPLRFGDVELVIVANGSSYRWPAVVGFSSAPVRYPILGQALPRYRLDCGIRGERILSGHNKLIVNSVVGTAVLADPQPRSIAGAGPFIAFRAGAK